MERLRLERVGAEMERALSSITSLRCVETGEVLRNP